jgi:hypothetical protein
MKEAYKDFNDGNYRMARRKLEALEDIYPEILIAEKYYLLSLCTSKNLNAEDLIRSKNYLIDWESPEKTKKVKSGLESPLRFYLAMPI